MASTSGIECSHEMSQVFDDLPPPIGTADRKLPDKVDAVHNIAPRAARAAD